MTDWSAPEAVDQVDELDTSINATAALSDPEAPYGRDKNGKPYKLSPEARAALTQRLSAGKAAGGSGRRRRTRARGSVSAPRASAKTASQTAEEPADIRMAVVGLTAIPTTVLTILGRRNPVFQLDAAAIATHAGELADGMVYAAQMVPSLERWLSKVAVAGPWTPLIMTAIGIGGQIAVNHGRMAPIAEFGIVSVPELQAKMEAAANRE